MKRIFTLLGLALAGGLGFGIWIVWGLPPRAEVRALARTNPKITSVMKQREEEAGRKGRKPRREQQWVSLKRVSRHLIHAVIVAEDGRFFGHEGIDWEAIRESAERDLRQGRLARGGSTITQQLAKNLFFTTRKSPVRKVREMIVARWLDTDLRKVRILELYLNLIEWGDGVFGCEAAARRYYGKPAAELQADEAAGLAAMIPSPRRINPQVNPGRFARAQRRVLWLMARAGYVKKEVGGLGATPPDLELESPDDDP